MKYVQKENKSKKKNEHTKFENNNNNNRNKSVCEIQNKFLILNHNYMSER